MLSAAARKKLSVLGLLCSYLLGLHGCGARTGLDAPFVESDVVEPDVQIPPTYVCVEPNPDAGPLTVELTTNAQVAVADVLFVIDRTGSMDQEIENIRDSLRSVIVPGLIRAIPDLQLGAVTYADFPVDPYGTTTDRAFALERRMGREFTALQGALGNIRAGGGGDNPEAMIEALYQVATGEGFGDASSPPGVSIPRAPSCPTIGVGYACLRPRSQPIIVLIADAPSHNGPPRMETSGGFLYNTARFRPGPAPHSYREAVDALTNRLRARVIGINSGVAPFSARPDLEQIARDTGSIGEDGRPLVFDINPDGTGLGEQVVRSVGRLTAEVRLNVSARAVDLGGNELPWVLGVRPVRAEPMERVQRVDATTFYGVVPGTRLLFGLDIDRSRLMPTNREQRFTLRIEFLADGRPALGFRDVEILIPPDGRTCQ